MRLPGPLSICSLVFMAWLPARAYSVLTHEAVIDAAWDQNIKPLLLKKYPQATEADLVVANLEVSGMVELVEALRRSEPALKVIAIEDATAIRRPIAVDAAHSRSNADWLATVKRVLDLRDETGAS